MHLGEFLHASRRISISISANSGADQEKYAHENEALRRELEEMTSPGADEQVIRRFIPIHSAIYTYSFGDVCPFIRLIV